MTTYYKAIAADGTALLRSTAGRKYTHCVAVHYVPYKETEKRWASNSWAGRPDLAHKEARRLAQYHQGDSSAVAVLPAIEITSKEYRSLK